MLLLVKIRDWQVIEQQAQLLFLLNGKYATSAN